MQIEQHHARLNRRAAGKIALAQEKVDRQVAVVDPDNVGMQVDLLEDAPGQLGDLVAVFDEQDFNSVYGIHSGSRFRLNILCQP